MFYNHFMSDKSDFAVKKDTSWHLLVVLWLVIIGMILTTNVSHAFLPSTLLKHTSRSLHSSSFPTLHTPEPNYQEELELLLIDTIKDMDGDIAIYIENLSSNRITSINNHPMHSASLIKLFVAGAYYEEIDNNNVIENDLSKAQLDAMISYSSNDAWVWLESYIAYGNAYQGALKITAFAKEHNYNDTGRLVSPLSLDEFGQENYTSVDDVGRVLREIYNEEYINKKASLSILTSMKNQERTSKIPSGLPEGIESANKTGELDSVQNDAAIIFADNIDYILVVMMDEVYNGMEAIENISKISELTYEYMSKINHH